MTELLYPKIYDPDRYLISTVIHQPEGKGPYPAIVLLPGFLTGKDDPTILLTAEFLCENGYLVARFDPTGLRESEGTIEDDYRLGTYLNCIDTVITYLKHKGNIDETRIGLWGCSLGGMLAIIFASEYSYINAVVAVSPPATVGSSGFFKEKISDWEKSGKLIMDYGEKGSVSIPDAFLRESRKYSALISAKSLKKPILTVVGSFDHIVSPDDSKSIFDAVSGTKKLVEIEGMTHEYLDDKKHRNKVYEVSLGFFNEYLK